MKYYLLATLIIGGFVGYVWGSQESAMSFCVNNLIDVRTSRGHVTTQKDLDWIKNSCEKRLQREAR